MSKLKTDMKKILMAHLYYGDPNEEFSAKLAETLLASEADILEVGIAYTDPVCDGEIFQRACRRAIYGGITPIKVFDGIKSLREKNFKQPIYLTSYYGPIYKIGIKKFVKLAKEAQVSGLIVPDILLEEQSELRERCDLLGLSLIQFVTPYSSIERVKEIVKVAGDFIYCISLPGVTGDRVEFIKLRKIIKFTKSLTDKKVFVGFGIKNSDDAIKILEMGADGVIVGSAIANIYEQNIANPLASLEKISAFIKDLKKDTIKI